MTLSWWRTRAGAIAPALLLALIALALPHGWGSSHNDPDTRLPTVVVHDAADHAMGAAATTSPDQADHCAICHWTRTFRHQTPATFSVADAPAPLGRLDGDDSTRGITGLAVQPPLRAPPSHPTAV